MRWRGTVSKSIELARVRLSGRTIFGAAAYIVGIVGMCLSSGAIHADLRIDLVLEEGAPARAALERPAAGHYGTRRDGGAVRLANIHCSNGAEVVRHIDYVVVPEGCDALRWSFDVTPYGPGEGMASDHSSRYSAAGAWWLVEEGTSLLRPVSATAGDGEDASSRGDLLDVEFFVDGAPVGIRAGPSAVPPMHEAPGLWLIGDPVFVDLGGVRHFFDSGVVPSHMAAVLGRHADAVTSLRESLPVGELSPVFWLGITTRGIGGMSGTGLILANYPLPTDGLGEEASIVALYTVVHEHAHQWFDGRGVLWLAESVASYLALRAIRDTTSAAFPFLEGAFLEPGRAAGESLQDLGARAVTDGEAYGMLYSVGAAFWWEFDALLKERGRDLLDVLFRLLAEGFNARGRPNMEAISAIVGVRRKALQPLFAHYHSVADDNARGTEE